MEIIDLISSSPLSHPIPLLKAIANSHDETVKPPSKRPVQGKSGAGKRDEDGWICLSDDAEKNNGIFSAGSNSKQRIESNEENPQLSTGAEEIFDDDFWVLDKDSVDTSEKHMGKRAKPAGPALEKEKEKEKGDNDFFFLSDDFDTTIDLDERSAILKASVEPVRKKRKLTPDQPLQIDSIALMSKNKGLQRAVSDIGSLSNRETSLAAKPAGLRRSKSNILNDDPIVFTSSPDDFRAAREKKEKLRLERERSSEGDDPFASDEFNKVIEGHASHQTRINASMNTLSSDDLPELGAIGSQNGHNVSNLSLRGSEKALAEYYAEKAAAKKTNGRHKSIKSVVRSAEDRARAAQEKLESKEAEKERKRLEREDKVREKQMAADLAKVNTLRIHKKDSTPEMIIDLPSDLEPRLADQVRQFLAPLDVECTSWQSPIPNVIKWRRKVQSTYNQEMEHWEPCARHIKPEKHVMCVMTAQEFVNFATGSEGQDLDAQVLKMKTKFPQCTLIYLLEGLSAWMRKNRNVKNRQFTEAVRSQVALEEGSLPGSSMAAHKVRKKKPPPAHIDEDLLEDALLRLQVQHQTLIHHTTAPISTAEQIRAFTQHIATIPYRHERMALEAGIGFCMESGQVATGADAADTFIKMLQEITRVTAPVAYGIAAHYPSVQALVRAFETRGRDVLADLPKSASRDGSVVADRRIGNRLSRRLCAIFLGKDEGSVDV